MTQLKTPVTAADHTRGAENPNVQIVEYGDFQCPYCGRSEPAVQRILHEFGSVVALTFRNFPLSDMHPMAYDAACVAEAAARQNKYWEMHDQIFANQKQLNPEHLKQLARQLGMDIVQLLVDAESVAVKRKVDADFEGGAESGVNGTPTFFINGRHFDGDGEDLYATVKAIHSGNHKDARLQDNAAGYTPQGNVINSGLMR